MYSTRLAELSDFFMTKALNPGKGYGTLMGRADTVVGPMRETGTCIYSQTIKLTQGHATRRARSLLY